MSKEYSICNIYVAISIGMYIVFYNKHSRYCLFPKLYWESHKHKIIITITTHHKRKQPIKSMHYICIMRTTAIIIVCIANYIWTTIYKLLNWDLIYMTL